MSAYRYAYCRANGEITVSAPFQDWDDCYGVYRRVMSNLSVNEDLASFKWRGVWDETDLLRVVCSELVGIHHPAFDVTTIVEG